MTIKESKKDDAWTTLCQLLDYLDGDEHALDGWGDPVFIHPEHGKVIGRDMDAFCDMIIYEDGHVERFMLGD